jgi:hypothetical protein
LLLANNYSGHSDLAVPSWLLAGALVARGGYLGIVAPQSWMSRDYAVPVLVMLRRFFRIHHLVEDAGTWFSNAQVRTSLIVAERVSSDRGQVGPRHSFTQVRLIQDVSDKRSPVGALAPRSRDPDKWFADRSRAGTLDHPLVMTNRRTEDWLDAHLSTRRSKLEWLPNSASDFAGTGVSEEFSHVLADGGFPGVRTIDLVSLGVEVGQGLRTGANDFFYVAVDEQLRSQSVLTGVSSKLLGSRTLNLVSSIAAPALRRQSDLGIEMVATVAMCRSAVLLLEGWATRTDVEASPLTSRRKLRVLSPELEDLISRAEQTRVGPRERLIPLLSAVASNVRKGTATSLPRFWYTLPTLQQRHRPDILVARVNADETRVALNRDRSCVVDANFTSLWLVPGAALDPEALLSVLISSWADAAFELVGTVLGAGGLKVEATHMRRFPLPALDSSGWDRMGQLGRALRDGRLGRAAARAEVDRLLDDALDNSYGVSTYLCSLAERLRVRRRR